MVRTALVSAAALTALAACATRGPHGGRYTTSATARGYDQVGTASWYGAAYDGRTTANGERFDMRRLSGAHPFLPIPSWVEVTNLENNRSIRVRLNDRGPFKDGRIIDLSWGAAQALGFTAQGVAKVRVRYLGPAPLHASAPETTSVRVEPAVAPISPVPASDRAGFAVQIGAFAERDNAERVLDLLQATGPAAIRRNGGGLYRVVAGPWEDQADAQQALRRLVGLGFQDARIVRF